MSHEDQSTWKKFISKLSTIHLSLYNLKQVLTSKISNFFREPINYVGCIFFIVISSYLYLKFTAHREQLPPPLPEGSLKQDLTPDELVKKLLPDTRNFLNRNFY